MKTIYDLIIMQLLFMVQIIFLHLVCCNLIAQECIHQSCSYILGIANIDSLTVCHLALNCNVSCTSPTRYTDFRILNYFQSL